MRFVLISTILSIAFAAILIAICWLSLHRPVLDFEKRYDVATGKVVVRTDVKSYRAPEPAETIWRIKVASAETVVVLAFAFVAFVLIRRVNKDISH